MMKNVNPFTITFGKQPNRQISRYEDVDKIVSTFDSENPISQTFLIEGIRGSGKTVLMTTAAKQLESMNDWIVINLNPTMELLPNFALRLEKACNSKSDILSKGFNLSAAGFGIGVNPDRQDTDYVGIIEKNFKKVIKENKKVLLTIDEVISDDSLKIFASQFQIFVRQDYPVFLIMTGLHENIYKIQNDPALTFLLRAPKIFTTPLSSVQIVKQYMEIFDLEEEKARELSDLTKGYAFAFQALGVAYWNHGKESIEKVLAEYDGLLDDFVYKKIWSTLTDKERKIIRAISTDDAKTGDVCKAVGINNSTFSSYREEMLSEGLIDTSKYGYVSLTLPRFYEITKNYRI